MRTDLFDFELPARQHRAAAREPARCRAHAGGAARRRAARPHRRAICRNGCEPGDQLVVNDTKVISAQLNGRRIGRETEPKIEATLIKRLDGSRWQALVKPAKKLAPGDIVRFGNEGKVCLLGHLDAAGRGQGRGRRGHAVVLVPRAGARPGDRRSRHAAAAALHRLEAHARRARRRRLPDHVRGQRGRGRGADGGTAFHARAGGGAARPRRRAAPA